MSGKVYPEWITDEYLARMHDDFRAFLKVIWIEYLNLPSPTRIQYDIAEYLMTGPKRRMIQAFRGVGKSWITCTYVVWRLWRDPQLRVLIVSANEKKATENATFVKGLINDVDFLAVLKGGERQSTLAFDVGPALTNPSPSVRCDGIFGQITGARADILLADDVEVPKNSETETMREKLAGRCAEFAAVKTRKGKDAPLSEVIYLGTPQSQESIYRDLPSKGYDIRIWTARYPLQDAMEHYGGFLAPLLLADLKRDPSLGESGSSALGGAPTDPGRFSDMDLLETEAEYRKAGFTLQYMLDTRLTDADRYPLKLKDLIVADWDCSKRAPVAVSWAGGPAQILSLPNVGFDGDRYHRPMYVSDEWDDYQGSVMVVDPSGRGSDETGWAITKMCHGMIYLVAAGGFAGGYELPVLEAVANLAKEHGVNKLLVEGNFGDGMYLQLLGPVLRRIYPVSMEEYSATGQKEARILDKLEPVIQGHRLVVAQEVIESDYRDTERNECRLMYQITHLTRDRGALRHDDRIDALAEAVGYWTRQMAKDVDKAESDYLEKQKKEVLDDFVRRFRQNKSGKNLRYII